MILKNTELNDLIRFSTRKSLRPTQFRVRIRQILETSETLETLAKIIARRLGEKRKS